MLKIREYVIAFMSFSATTVYVSAWIILSLYIQGHGKS